MPAQIQPDACPKCGRPLQLPYKERRKATMTLSAKLVLAAGIGATILLVILSFVLVGSLVSEQTRDLELPRRRRGLFFALVHLPPLVLSFLPAWLAYRFAFSRPLKLTVACPSCSWSGPCRITEKGLPFSAPTSPAEVGETEFEGIPIQGDQIRKRLDRLKERRRKEARRADEEAGPNPDFDFDR